MELENEVVIVAAKRSPIGSFQGALSSLSAPEIGSKVMQSLMSDFDDLSVDEVFLGNVISAGIGQAPARQAALMAGFDDSIPCSTISKVCGSGMQALIFASQSIAVGENQFVLAGGMESMSNAPYLLPRVRAGLRLGHSETIDSMFTDGLEDAETGKLMGHFGQMSADQAGYSREQLDDYALASLSRASDAIKQGLFVNEIVPMKMTSKGKATHLIDDEQVANARPEKVRFLKPAFKQGGTVTAANSSSISDGAAALLVCSSTYAQAKSLSPLARIVASSKHANMPSKFTSAPISAITKVLAKADWSVDEVDLFEVNEAFALVPMLVMDALKISHEKININGGACALGHPLGASGARIIVSLIHALKQRGMSKGVASICIGGGEATAIALQIID